MDTKKTGAFIAELRKEKALTQTALAKRLNISNRTVSKWENGDGYPDITMLPALASALGVSVDELLQGEKAQEEASAEVLFDIEYTPSASLYRKGQITYLSQKVPLSTFVVSAFLGVALIFALKCVFYPFGSTVFNVGMIIELALIFAFSAMLFLYGIAHIRTLKAKNGGILPSSHVILSDRIYCRDGALSENYSYDRITGFFIGKDVYVVKLYKRLILVLPKEAFGDKQQELEAFIRERSPVTVNVKTHVFLKVLNVLWSVLAVALILLGSYNLYLKNDAYLYRDIDTKTAYFEQYESEFTQGVGKVRADKKLAEELKEYESTEGNAADYLTLERLSYVIETNDSVTFVVDGDKYNGYYFSAYIFYEGDKSYRIVSFNYIRQSFKR